MEMFLTLTETDKAILNSYNTLINHLGDYLGEGYEIILHSLETLDNSVINIYNGHYSNRVVGSPITELALSMIATLNGEGSDHPLTYFNTSKSGTRMKSCTIPIKGENDRIIGLVCMNFYMNISIETFVSQLTNVKNYDHPQEVKPAVESYSQTSSELLVEAVKNVESQVINDATISQQNKNGEIIRLLNDKGIFNLKDSVVEVADLLHISKNTVYMHLRKLKSEE